MKIATFPYEKPGVSAWGPWGPQKKFHPEVVASTDPRRIPLMWSSSTKSLRGPYTGGPGGSQWIPTPASSAPRRRSWIGRPSCSTKQPLGGTWLDDVRWLVKVDPDAIWIRCKTLRGNPIGLLGWNNWICSCCLTYGGIWNDIRQKDYVNVWCYVDATA